MVTTGDPWSDMLLTLMAQELLDTDSDICECETKQMEAAGNEVDQKAAEERTKEDRCNDAMFGHHNPWKWVAVMADLDADALDAEVQEWTNWWLQQDQGIMTMSSTLVGYLPVLISSMQSGQQGIHSTCCDCHYCIGKCPQQVSQLMPVSQHLHAICHTLIYHHPSTRGILWVPCRRTGLRL